MITKKHAIYLAIIILAGIPLLGLLSSHKLTNKLRHNQSEVSMGSESFMDDQGAIEPDFARSNSMIVPPGEPPVYDEGFTQDVEDRTIVKTAYLSMVVADVRGVVDQTNAIVKKFSGTITSSQVSEDIPNKGVITANLTIRVPVADLESTLKEIQDLASKVTDVSITAQDRTEQKIDLEVQIKNLKATEDQLLVIMKRAVSVEETLQVQRELTQTRSRIERLEAQLENLQGSAAMSTINLSLSTEESSLPIIDDGEKSLWQEIKLTLRTTVTLYRNLFVSGIKLAIIAAPILIIIVPIYLLRRAKTKNKK